MPKPPRQFRSQAIILSRRDFGESDRLLTLFTPARGKIRAIAKGARKPSAKVSGHVELFARSDVMIHKGRNLDILTQAELVEPYLGLRDDLARGAYANYIAELLDRFTADEEDESGALFALLDATMSRVADAADPRLAARFFELHLLDLVGFRPELSECVVSREELVPESQYFSQEEGGVVSRAAGAGGGVTPDRARFRHAATLAAFAAQRGRLRANEGPAYHGGAASAGGADHAGLYHGTCWSAVWKASPSFSACVNLPAAGRWTNP